MEPTSYGGPLDDLEHFDGLLAIGGAAPGDLGAGLLRPASPSRFSVFSPQQPHPFHPSAPRRYQDQQPDLKPDLMMSVYSSPVQPASLLAGGPRMDIDTFAGSGLGQSLRLQVSTLAAGGLPGGAAAGAAPATSAAEGGTQPPSPTGSSLSMPWPYASAEVDTFVCGGSLSGDQTDLPGGAAVASNQQQPGAGGPTLSAGYAAMSSFPSVQQQQQQDIAGFMRQQYQQQQRQQESAMQPQQQPHAMQQPGFLQQHATQPQQQWPAAVQPQHQSDRYPDGAEGRAEGHHTLQMFTRPSLASTAQLRGMGGSDPWGPGSFSLSPARHSQRQRSGSSLSGLQRGAGEAGEEEPEDDEDGMWSDEDEEEDSVAGGGSARRSGDRRLSSASVGGDGQSDGEGGHGGSRGRGRGGRGGRGGTKRGGAAGGGKDSRNLTVEDKRSKRLERNRESARQSRLRKKQYLELLEARAVALREDMARLRFAHIAAAEAELAAQRAMLLTSLYPLSRKPLLTPEEEASLIDGVAQLLDRFGPDCPERRAVRESLFLQLMQLMQPPHTKFLLWLIHQPLEFFSGGGAGAAGMSDEFSSPMMQGGGGGGTHGAGIPALDLGASASAFAPSAATASASSQPTGAAPGPAGGPSLWSLLCSEIGIAAEQADRLRIGLRRVLAGADVPRETWRLGVAASYLTKLKASVQKRAAEAQAQLGRLRDILSPAQMIVFAAWSEAHGERMRSGDKLACGAAAAAAAGGGAVGGGESGDVAMGGLGEQPQPSAELPLD